MTGSRSGTISRRRVIAGLTLLGAGGAATLKTTRALASAISGGTADIPTADAIRLSIRNIVREGVTDVFDRPVEVQLLADNAQFRRLVALRTLDRIGAGKFPESGFSPLEFVETPKSTYGLRRTCAVMDPLDTAVYLALAIMVAPAVERKRPSVKEDRIFSYRFAPDRGRLFDRRIGFTQFHDAIRQRRSESNFIVRCDIERFYPNISPGLARDSLERCAAPAQAVDYLSRLLEFWNPNGDVGLPIGSNASRILAESTLIPVDDALNRDGINFVRFVDDYCLFAEDEKAAALGLEALNDHLSVYKFSLNAAKTTIINTAFIERFEDAAAVTSNRDLQPSPSGRPAQSEIEKQMARIGPKPRVSGRPGVSRKFRLATKREIGKLVRAPRPDATRLINGVDLVQPWELRRSLRIAAYTNDATFLTRIPEILKRYPEFSSYVSGMLMKRAASLSKEVRTVISSKMAAMLLDLETPTFVALDLLPLLSTPEFQRRSAIRSYASFQAKRARGIRLQASLRALRLTGGIPSDLFRECVQADAWTILHSARRDRAILGSCKYGRGRARLSAADGFCKDCLVKDIRAL